MFRTKGDQPTLRNAVLPAKLLALPEELARVDALLDDPAFVVPLAPFLGPTMGRPSIPMETYLRLLFLKFRHRLATSRVPGGGRLNLAAAVRPDRHRRAGATPDNADEDHQPGL